RLMAESNAASSTWSGENNSDCGSEICAPPAKTFGVHHRHLPRAMEVARNCACGKNCDFASHGIVTAPESHGQAGSRKASAKIASVTATGTRAAETSAAAGDDRPAPARQLCTRSVPGVRAGSSCQAETALPSAGTGAWSLRVIPLSPCEPGVGPSIRDPPQQRTRRCRTARRCVSSVDHEAIALYCGGRTERPAHDDDINLH